MASRTFRRSSPSRNRRFAKDSIGRAPTTDSHTSSSDAGANWSDVTKNVPGLPAGANVSRLAPSRFESNRVYATFDAHRVNDFGIYVFTSDDLGESWRSLGSNLPAGEIARTMMEDLKNPDVLYLGTERGLYVTVDRGREWHRVNANLPTVPIYEIALHPRENDMILATHGRSIWILDDLTPFQDYAKAAETDAHVFATAPATQHTPAGNRIPEFGGDRRFFGKNPEAGMLTYRLRSDVEEATIEIRDSNRTVVTEIEAMTSAGIHQVGWDLRFAPLPEVKGHPTAGVGERDTTARSFLPGFIELTWSSTARTERARRSRFLRIRTCR